MITSRGRPVACLIGLHPDDVLIRPRGRLCRRKIQTTGISAAGANLETEAGQGQAVGFQEDHDDVLYGEPTE